MSKSARLFLERHSMRPTFRNPTATVAPESYAIHTIALSALGIPSDAPMPVPDAVYIEPPLSDRNQTAEPWPYAKECT